MKTKCYHNRSGSTVAVVICIMATLMVIAGIAAEYTMTVNRNAWRNDTLETALAVGDSCIEILFYNWRATCRATPTQALKTNAFSAVPTPTPSEFPNIPAISNFVKRGTSYDPGNDEYNANYTISNYKIVAVSPEWQSLGDANTVPTPMLGQLTSAISSVSATTPATYNYIASADVTLPSLGSNKTVVAKVRRVFQKQILSPWNWAIFYVDPLEIHPGPQFTVTGWVHTNSNLYTGHNTLTFADKVTFGTDWSIGFMPGDGQHPETPASPNYPSGLPPARDQSLQPMGLDSTSIFNTTDSNPNNDSYRELIQPPVAGYPDPLASQRYWNQANVAVKVDASNNVTIGTPNSDGTITSLGPPAWPLPDLRTNAQKNLYNAFSGAITTNQTIQDNREGASIRVATLDISQILQAGQNPPAYKSSSFNGIVYIYDSSNSSSTRRGIRIKNGSNIPTSGLTVVSNNPIYIQGDFNTGGTGSTVPSNNPSNLNADGTYINPTNPPSPQVSGYTRAPCSILADAVDILSNSWNDANAGTVPAASPTTVNTAIIAGIVPTSPVGGDGAYSGGAENFPRFLEDWTNKTLSYYGSMVELYKSQQSIGEWGKANVYVPPARQWYFDTNFKTTPPPGSIMIYSYVKGKWYVL